MTTPAFYSGTGRRKTAVARVRLLPGEGEIVVNGRSLEEHFGNAINEADVRMPFRVTGTEGRFNAMIKVEGGGVTGQAGAIRHGIARALLEVDADDEPPAAAPGRPPHPRPADEGAQEVRAEARPQGAAVHQAVAAAVAERAAVRRLQPRARYRTATSRRGDSVATDAVRRSAARAGPAVRRRPVRDEVERALRAGGGAQGRVPRRRAATPRRRSPGGRWRCCSRSPACGRA